MLRIVNDNTMTMWTFLISHKNIVDSTLKHFLAMIQTHYNCKVKYIRTNNGTEFVNDDCARMFRELGIIHHRTCPHSRTGL